MTAQKQPVVPSELHPLSIIRMLWKRKVIVALVWAVGTIGTGAVVWKLPPIYKSEALIVVDSQKIPDRYVTSTVSTDIGDRIATISQQILSSTNLKKIIDDFGLYKDQRASRTEEEIHESLRADISIHLEKGWTGNRPGAFRVGYQGKDPAVVAQVTNRLANLYIEENLRVREVQAEGTSEFMGTQLVEAKKRLDQLEASVSEYKLKHNGELPQQENTISGELTRNDLALQTNHDAVRRAQDSLPLYRNMLEIAESTVTALSQPRSSLVGIPSNPNQSSTAADPTQPISPAQKKVELLRAKINAMQDAGYKDAHPEVRYAKEMLAFALADQTKEQAEIEKKAASEAATAKHPAPTPLNGTLAATTRPAVPMSNDREREVTLARERVLTLKSQITSLENEIKERAAEQGQIQERITLLQTRLASLPVREQEMAGLTRDYEISKANYKSLLDKNTSAEMATDMEKRQKSERFSLLDPARVPEKPAKPNRPLFGAIGSLVALGLGLVWGIGLEVRKSCVLGEWELPKGTVVLGRVPIIAAFGAQALAPNPPRRSVRRLVFGLASVFVLVVIAAGLYIARSLS